MRNERTEAASLKDVYTVVHNAQWITYYILIQTSVIQSSLARGKTLLFIKSVNSFIVLYMCDMFRAIKIFKWMYHEQVRVVGMRQIRFGT